VWICGLYVPIASKQGSTIRLLGAYSQQARDKLLHTSTHHPLSIIADSDALAGFFELEVL